MVGTQPGRPFLSFIHLVGVGAGAGERQPTRKAPNRPTTWEACGWPGPQTDFCEALFNFSLALGLQEGEHWQGAVEKSWSRCSPCCCNRMCAFWKVTSVCRTSQYQLQGSWGKCGRGTPFRNVGREVPKKKKDKMLMKTVAQFYAC